MAGAYQAIIDDLMDRHFPVKITKRKEDDLPWLDGVALRMIKKKKAIYKAAPRRKTTLKREDRAFYKGRGRNLVAPMQQDSFSKMLRPSRRLKSQNHSTSGTSGLITLMLKLRPRLLPISIGSARNSNH